MTDLNDRHHQEKFSEIKEVASRLNITIEDLALIWVYQFSFVKIVLTGAATIDQLNKNFNSMEKINLNIPYLNDFNLPTLEYWDTRKNLSWN